MNIRRLGTALELWLKPDINQDLSLEALADHGSKTVIEAAKMSGSIDTAYFAEKARKELISHLQSVSLNRHEDGTLVNLILSN